MGGHNYRIGIFLCKQVSETFSNEKKCVPNYLCIARVGGASLHVSLTLFTVPLTRAFYIPSMSTNIYAHNVVNHDNHKELTINVSSGANVNEIVRHFMADDVEPVKNEEPAPAEKPYTPPIPQERKYSQVREYIKERKKYDQEFKQFCDTHSLRDLCTKLTREFGWFVDENSLSQNLNRHM